MNSTLTTEYNTWRGMKRRCLNPKAHNYKYYGGRGITVSSEWANSFQRFLSDVGHKPTPSHTLDRIDNSKGYEPGNCRWATKHEQQLNTRTRRFGTLRRTVGDKAYRTIYQRMYSHGWSFERAVSTPIKKYKLRDR